MLDLRRWPLLIPLLAIVSGLALTRTDILAIFPALLLLLIVFALLFIFKQRVPAVLLVLAALWGAADLMVDASRIAVDETWLHSTIQVSATVEKAESLTGSQRYLVGHIRRTDGTVLAGKALLYRYRPAAGDALIQAGERIRVQVRWRLPRNYHNPGAFDYRSWCFDRQIAVIGSVHGKLAIVDASVSWLEQQRQKLRRVMRQLETPDHGVLPALLLAERAQVSAPVSRLFAATGTAHLLAISGMHIGMVAAWVFALLWFVLTRREAWIVHLPVRNIALSGGFLAACAYGAIAAWPLPAIRAVLMLGAAVLAWCFSSRSEPINTLLAALGLILLFDPSAVASLSLWLSFVATASLLLWAGSMRSESMQVEVAHSEKRVTWPHRVVAAGGTLLWISMLATLATLPLIVSSFGQIPLYALLANMIMVPLYALLVMPLSLLGAVCALLTLDGWAGALMSMASMVIAQGLDFLSVLTALPAGALWAVHPCLGLSLLYAAGMVFSGWLLWRKQRLKAGCSVFLVLLVYVFFVLHENDVRQPLWMVWDVGQGAASTLILPGRRVIVVDVPGRAGSRFNGGTTVAAGLRTLGLTHVDVLILSHAQSDHLGGALSLLRNVNSVGEIWLPDVPDAHSDKRVESIERYARAHGVLVRWMGRGDVKRWGDAPKQRVSLQVLWPPGGHAPRNINNTSLVVRADVNVDGEAYARLLWPGDIEREAEQALVQGGLGPVDVMLMPHHGSRSSSHEAFVQALHPELAVAQTGVGNRYAFPAAAVVARYQRLHARLRNTAEGAVLVHFKAGEHGADVRQWSAENATRRDMARAWWNAL